MRALKAFSAAALTVLLFAGILTQWVPYRWAVSLYQLGAFLLAIVWTLRFAIRPFPLTSHILLLPLSAIVLWGLAQLIANQTVYRWETWNELLKWGTNLTLFLLALQIFSDPALRERFLRSILLFGVTLSVVGSIQMFSSPGRIFWLFPTEYKDFVVGPFVYHSQYAGFVELVLPLAVVGALRDRRRRPAYAAMAAVLYASVLASASRAGALLLTGEILVIFFIAMRRRQAPLRSRAVTLGLLAAFALAFTAVLGWNVLLERFSSADPFAVRREFLQASLAMVRARPWMGFGLGTWSTAYPAYAVYDNGLFANQAHNDWVQWAAEGGLPMLFLMLWIAARSAGAALRSLWGIGVLAVFVHCLVDYPLQRPALAGFFFVFLGVVESAKKNLDFVSGSYTNNLTSPKV
jgi:O-antigen ligase